MGQPVLQACPCSPCPGPLQPLHLHALQTASLQCLLMPLTIRRLMPAMRVERRPQAVPWAGRTHSNAHAMWFAHVGLLSMLSELAGPASNLRHRQHSFHAAVREMEGASPSCLSLCSHPSARQTALHHASITSGHGKMMLLQLDTGTAFGIASLLPALDANGLAHGKPGIMPQPGIESVLKWQPANG